MQNVANKSISVILKLEEFSALNGELSKINHENERSKYIYNFFFRRYGSGDGQLTIIQKPSKVKLIWSTSAFSSEAEGFHKSALNLAKSKKYSDAVANWVKAISINPKDPDYYFNLGIAFFETKNYKESIENLRRALAICPIYYKAHLILGTVHLKIRNFEEAEKHLKESINFNPNHGLAYLNLGAVYSILKRYDDGINMFMKALDLAPNETRAYFGLGKIYSIKGDVEKANQYFKRVIELDKNGDLANHAKRALQVIPGSVTDDSVSIKNHPNIENLYQEGYKAFLMTDYDLAIKMYQAYLNQKPDDDFVWFALGEACLRTGHLDKSAEAFQKAIKLNPSKGLYYKELAIVFYYQQKANELIQCLAKAKQLGKSDSVLSSLEGYALMKQEKYRDALATLQEANRLDSNNLLGKFFLAQAFQKCGDNNSAVNLLEAIKQSGSKSPLVATSDRILRELAQT